MAQPQLPLIDKLHLKLSTALKEFHHIVLTPKRGTNKQNISIPRKSVTALLEDLDAALEIADNIKNGFSSDVLPSFIHSQLTQSHLTPGSREYESQVDCRVLLLLRHFFPPEGGFMIGNQWTYNPEQFERNEEWSTYVQVSELTQLDTEPSEGGTSTIANITMPSVNRSCELESIETVDDLSERFEQDIQSTSTPVRGRVAQAEQLIPLFQHVDVGPFEPPVDKASPASEFSDVALDPLGNLVSTDSKTPRKLPDFIVFRGRELILVVEDKLDSKVPGIRQLSGYMEDIAQKEGTFGMACCHGSEGIEVMFLERKADRSLMELKGKILDQTKYADCVWYPATDPLVLGMLNSMNKNALVG